MGRKVGCCCAPFRWELGRQLTMSPLAWVVAYLRTKWYPDPSSRLATTDMGELSLHLAQWGHGPRPSPVPSGILINLTIWPYTNITDRLDWSQTDRTDNGPIA